MFILIPVGMKYRSRAVGSAMKDVTCVHCQTQFFYEMRRVVVAEASAPGFVGKKRAADRSATGAQGLLQKALARESDPVPCPGCGRLQPAMNRALQRRWALWIGGVWVFVLIGVFIGYMGAMNGTPLWTKVVPVVATFAAAGMGVWVFMREFRWSSAQPVQVKREGELGGRMGVMLPRVREDGWIWARGTRFVSSQVCAGCGGESVDRLGRRLGSFKIEVRVCGACCRRATWLQGTWGAISALVPWGIVFVVSCAAGECGWDRLDDGSGVRGRCRISGVGDCAELVFGSGWDAGAVSALSGSV